MRPHGQLNQKSRATIRRLSYRTHFPPDAVFRDIDVQAIRALLRQLTVWKAALRHEDERKEVARSKPGAMPRVAAGD
jgi:hypothetical protein